MCGCLLSKTFAVLVHSSDCPLRPAFAYRTIPPHTCQSVHDPTITLTILSFITPFTLTRSQSTLESTCSKGTLVIRPVIVYPPHASLYPLLCGLTLLFLLSSPSHYISSQTLKGLTLKGCATVAQSTCTLSRFNSPSSLPFPSPPLPPSLLHSPSFIAAPSFSCSTLQLQHQRTFS